METTHIVDDDQVGPLMLSVEEEKLLGPDHPEVIRRKRLAHFYTRFLYIWGSLCLVIDAILYGLTYTVSANPIILWYGVFLLTMELANFVLLIHRFTRKEVVETNLRGTSTKRVIWYGITEADMRLLEQSGCGDIFLRTCQRVGDWGAVTMWRSARVLLMITLLLVLIQPAGLYQDMFGEPTNRSSCTTNASSLTGQVYHPAGYFNSERAYTSTFIGKFCPMFQRYAYPISQDYVYGYPYRLIGVNNAKCPPPLTPTDGAATTINGWPATTQCPYDNLLVPMTRPAKSSIYSSFPSPVLGLATPILTSTLPDPGRRLCPGNSRSELVCVNPLTNDAYLPQNGSCPVGEARLGYPTTICPYCLQRWRRMSQDEFGPPGYEHCQAYNVVEGQEWWCDWCPGLGYGWMHNLRYDEHSIALGFYLMLAWCIWRVAEPFLLVFIIECYPWTVLAPSRHKIVLRTADSRPLESERMKGKENEKIRKRSPFGRSPPFFES